MILSSYAYYIILSINIHQSLLVYVSLINITNVQLPRLQRMATQVALTTQITTNIFQIPTQTLTYTSTNLELKDKASATDQQRLNKFLKSVKSTPYSKLLKDSSSKMTIIKCGEITNCLGMLRILISF